MFSESRGHASASTESQVAGSLTLGCGWTRPQRGRQSLAQDANWLPFTEKHHRVAFVATARCALQMFFLLHAPRSNCYGFCFMFLQHPSLGVLELPVPVHIVSHAVCVLLSKKSLPSGRLLQTAPGQIGLAPSVAFMGVSGRFCIDGFVCVSALGMWCLAGGW